MSAVRTAPLSGLDLAAPGGLEALFASMRARFGEARMSADAGDTGGGGQQDGQDGSQGDQQDTGGQNQGGQQQAPQNGDWDGKVESLPAGAQKLINDLRKADGDERIAMKTLSAIQKALNPDAPDAKPDPAALAQQLTAEQARSRETATELAVVRAAVKAGIDAEELLDRNSFMSKVKAFDPAAENFTSKVAEVVKKAGEDNPRLKVGRVPGASSADHAGGSGEKRTRTPQPLDRAVDNAYAGR